MINERSKLINLVFTGLLTAIICVTTAFLFHIPTGVNGGYIHIGDAFIYLAASILPLPYALFAAAVGGAFADLLCGAAIWAIPTLIIKPVLVLFFSCKSNKILTKRNIIATIFAGIVGVLLYAIAEGVLFGNFLAALASSLFGSLQPLGSALVYIALGLALDKINVKEKLIFR